MQNRQSKTREKDAEKIGGENNEKWKVVVDFTEINKTGVGVDQILALL